MRFRDLLASFFDERQKIDTCRAPDTSEDHTSFPAYGEVLWNNEALPSTEKMAPDVDDFQVIIGPM